MVIHPIVIIGAGPAGIATAAEAIKRGHDSSQILLLEKSGRINHMIAEKYPEEKPVLANYKNKVAACLGDLCIGDMTKAEFLDFMDQVVLDLSLNIIFHQSVTRIEKKRSGHFLVSTESDSYLTDTVFVAIGNMSAPRTLGVSIDPQVAKHIQYDLNKIRPEDQDVLVVGGGDSAGEYAMILAGRGHRVTLSYRKKEFMRMIDQNREQLQKFIDEDRIQFLPQSEIKRIECHQGKPFVFFKSSYQERSFDQIVTALGSERPNQYLGSLGIDLSLEDDDPEEIYNESKMGGLFFVGDLASGRSGGTINFAFDSGTKAIEKACSLYLDCHS